MSCSMNVYSSKILYHLNRKKLTTDKKTCTYHTVTGYGGTNCYSDKYYDLQGMIDDIMINKENK